jgi:hypothetical protein
MGNHDTAVEAIFRRSALEAGLARMPDMQAVA